MSLYQIVRLAFAIFIFLLLLLILYLKNKRIKDSRQLLPFLAIAICTYFISLAIPVEYYITSFSTANAAYDYSNGSGSSVHDLKYASDDCIFFGADDQEIVCVENINGQWRFPSKILPLQSLKTANSDVYVNYYDSKYTNHRLIKLIVIHQEDTELEVADNQSSEFTLSSITDIPSENSSLEALTYYSIIDSSISDYRLYINKQQVLG